MRRTMVAGNWKMHGTRASVAELINGLRHLALPSGVDVAVFPPCLHINQVVDGLKGKSIQVGAQNSAVEPMQGALTGEISPSQLVDAGCSYVLVGHSERRQMMGERDGTLNRKFAAAQACGLIPVLCIGETLEQRESGKTLEVVSRQLGSIIEEQGAGGFALQCNLARFFHFRLVAALQVSQQRLLLTIAHTFIGGGVRQTCLTHLLQQALYRCFDLIGQLFHRDLRHALLSSGRA